MARRSISERLAHLDAQRKNLQSRLSQQERAKDTRRKVLLGAFVLYRLEKPDGSEFSKSLKTWLKRELPQFLTRDDDKKLFDDLIAAPRERTGPAVTPDEAKTSPP